jgi:hypothetical protein
MCDCVNILTTNTRGVPYLATTGVVVGSDTVDFSLGFRSIPRAGYLTIRISNAIPTGTTGTLPVRFTLNGQTRALTSYGGVAITAADLTAAGVITVFYDWFDGTLQIMSPIV